MQDELTVMLSYISIVSVVYTLQILHVSTPVATFSKLLRKILGSFLILGES